jgi:hypothetical protein
MDVAFEMDDVRRTAMCIVFSEQESGEVFDWDLMAFPERI